MAKKPSTLSIADLDAPVILSFLESLEQQRHNQAQSRNVRLTAIRSFFRLVAIRDPASVGVATRVLAIPLKRVDQHLVGYLTRPEVDAILAANNLTAWNGRRDHALLLSLYNTGARVSEIISLRWSHFSFGVKSFVQFKGKGRKERLSRSGIRLPGLYRLGSVSWSTVPLRSFFQMLAVLLWPERTHGYVEADMAIKERALQKLAPAGKPITLFKADDALLTFLASL
jgi:Phage integrase family